jgi:hypothetical protein
VVFLVQTGFGMPEQTVVVEQTSTCYFDVTALLDFGGFNWHGNGNGNGNSNGNGNNGNGPGRRLADDSGITTLTEHLKFAIAAPAALQESQLPEVADGVSAHDHGEEFLERELHPPGTDAKSEIVRISHGGRHDSGLDTGSTVFITAAVSLASQWLISRLYATYLVRGRKSDTLP